MLRPFLVGIGAIAVATAAAAQPQRLDDAALDRVNSALTVITDVIDLEEEASYAVLDTDRGNRVVIAGSEANGLVPKDGGDNAGVLDGGTGGRGVDNTTRDGFGNGNFEPVIGGAGVAIVVGRRDTGDGANGGPVGVPVRNGDAGAGQRKIAIVPASLDRSGSTGSGRIGPLLDNVAAVGNMARGLVGSLRGNAGLR